MIAIQSLWTKPWGQNKCGWNSLEDLLASQELSVILLRKYNQFSSIIFYTDKKGYDLTQSLHHYYDEVIVNLNDIDWVESYNWAFQKLYIYVKQNKPFVHIDSDVYLWDGLPKHWIDGKLDFFFQGMEMIEYYPFYIEGLKEIEDLHTENFLPYMPKYAVNCGVAGFCDLTIIPKYFSNAKETIERNQKHHWKHFRQKHHQCVLFEQLFLVPLIEGKKIEYILDIYTKEIAGIRYTHLLADSKRNEKNILNMKNKLKFYKQKNQLICKIMS